MMWTETYDWLPTQVRASVHDAKLLAEYDVAVILAEEHAKALRAGADDARADHFRARLDAKLDEVLAQWEAERCA